MPRTYRCGSPGGNRTRISALRTQCIGRCATGQPLGPLVVEDLVQLVDRSAQVFLVCHDLVDILVSRGVLVQKRLSLVYVPGLPFHQDVETVHAIERKLFLGSGPAP